MTGFELKKIVGMFIILLVAFLLLSAIFRFNNPLSKAFLDIFDLGDDKEEKKLMPEEAVEEFAQYNRFLQEFKSCLEIPVANCYCKLSTNYIAGQTIEFENQENNLMIKVYDSSEDDVCDEPKKNVKEETINAKQIYFENTLGNPNVKENKLDINNFIIAEKVYFSKDKICSTKDVRGSNDIKLNSGIIYKFSLTNIALTRYQEGLESCQSLQNPKKEEVKKAKESTEPIPEPRTDYSKRAGALE